MKDYAGRAVRSWPWLSMLHTGPAATSVAAVHLCTVLLFADTLLYAG